MRYRRLCRTFGLLISTFGIILKLLALYRVSSMRGILLTLRVDITILTLQKLE